MKVVITRYGGFRLSDRAQALYTELSGKPLPRCVERHDPYLVQVVKELGDEANGRYASLVVVEIPNNLKYVIMDYDGYEHIAEEHRTWHG